MQGHIQKQIWMDSRTGRTSLSDSSRRSLLAASLADNLDDATDIAELLHCTYTGQQVIGADQHCRTVIVQDCQVVGAMMLGQQENSLCITWKQFMREWKDPWAKETAGAVS